MDIAAIIDALGGGPVSVALIGLAFLYFKERQANNKLVEKIIDISRDQVVAISELTRRIDGSHK